MSKKLFDYDPTTGTTKWWHYDADRDEATIETEFKIDDLIEDNKAHFNNTDERERWGEWTRVASVPMPLYFTLKKQGIADDQAALKRWLNDPDNRLFRTRPGRV